jgi:hypothetical protein
VFVVAPALVGASPAFAAGGATCSQLTAKQVQPLVSDPITKVSSKPVSGTLYFTGNKQVGQACTFATSDTESALTVTVIGGPAAAKAYAAELQRLGAHVSVAGVGAKAVRARVDSDGAVSTAELLSLKGSTFCQVTPQADLIPGVGKLEEAAGFKEDIGNDAYVAIANAIGTVCNRVYKSGNTTPDLSKLTAAAASVTVTTADEQIGG